MINEKEKMKRYLLAKIDKNNTIENCILIDKNELYKYFNMMIKGVIISEDDLEKIINKFNIKFVITRFSMRWILDIRISPSSENYINMKDTWEFKNGDIIPIVTNLKTFGYTKDIYGFFVPINEE